MLAGGTRTDRIVVRRGACSAERAAALSMEAFAGGDRAIPELWLLEPTSTATLAGAFQASEWPLRRASGGTEVVIGPGVVHVLLSLPAPSAFEAIRVDAILNRHVRPVLRAISRSGPLAHYFGRDWISASHRPVALVGFAHEARTQRTLFEAFVAVNRSVLPRPRASYRDREPATIAELAGRSIATDEIADRIERAVLDAHGLTADARTLPEPSASLPWAPRPRAWSRVHEEAIGPIGIGLDDGGHVRLGGELTVSFDALGRLEAALDSIDRGSAAAVARAVEEALGSTSVALFGVRSLDSLVALVLDSGIPANQ
jgi:hypothetical protein